MMSKRWKPECCESYYFMDAVGTVNSHTWWDDTADRLYYAIGNCFRSLEEAEAATAKVKALLLSLHEPATDCSQSVTDCKQLPKLTAEVFDRPDCPEWAKSAAVDDDGHAYWYEYLPYTKDRAGMWDKSKNQCQFIGGGYDTTDWRNSLVERPTKLPEWCKAGAYVYDSLYGYGEIVFAAEDHFYAEFDGHAAEYSLENIPELKQARLRQYTAAELRKLVGTIIEETACGAGNSSLLVTAYNSGIDCDTEPAVMLLAEWIGVNALCSGDYSVDGHVCGVFEHVDAGEWVE